MKFGAVDFLSKPVAHEELGRAIRRSLDRIRESIPSSPAPRLSPSAGVFLSNNPRMREIQALSLWIFRKP